MTKRLQFLIIVNGLCWQLCTVGTLLLISISSARLMFTRGGGDRHPSQVICEVEIILCPIELNISFVLV